MPETMKPWISFIVNLLALALLLSPVQPVMGVCTIAVVLLILLIALGRPAVPAAKGAWVAYGSGVGLLVGATVNALLLSLVAKRWDASLMCHIVALLFWLTLLLSMTTRVRTCPVRNAEST